MFKLTKSQRKQARLHAGLKKDLPFQTMMEKLSKGHDKISNLINRGIEIQSAKIGK